MDASLHKRAEQLATEFASQARTAEDLNGLMRLMMKSALERMLNTGMDVHLGRRPAMATLAPPAAELSPAAPRARKRSPNRRNGRAQRCPACERDLGATIVLLFPLQVGLGFQAKAARSRVGQAAKKERRHKPTNLAATAPIT